MRHLFLIAIILVVASCTGSQTEPALPAECSDQRLAETQGLYTAEVLAACKGQTFDECEARIEIEERYAKMREEWAKCPQRH